MDPFVPATRDPALPVVDRRLETAGALSPVLLGVDALGLGLVGRPPDRIDPDLLALANGPRGEDGLVRGLDLAGRVDVERVGAADDVGGKAARLPETRHERAVLETGRESEPCLDGTRGATQPAHDG